MSSDLRAATSGSADAERPRRVFISYSHESPEHVELVRRFGTFLREEVGVDARLDLWDDDGRRDWSAWAIEQLENADFIIAIASPGYKRKADGFGPASEGRGARFEAAIMRNNLTRNLPEETRRILPVVLPGQTVDDIPAFLCGYSATHYVVSEFTVAAVQDLLVAFTGVPLYRLPPLGRFTPPTRPAVHPIAVAASTTPASSDGILAVGAEVAIGRHGYLVHGDQFEEQPVADSAAVRRQARALRIGPPHTHVWLRQVEVRQETAAAQELSAALHREHGLLAELSPYGSTLPRPLGVEAHGRLTTLVSTWPVAGKTGAPCDTLASFVPPPGEAVDRYELPRTLRRVADLGSALARLHERGLTHRYLTPAGIIRLDDGRLALRDLGLAAVAQRPGEGPKQYRAPEQQRRRGGAAGPWTDVFQLAALTCQLLSGHLPTTPFALPASALVPGLPDAAAVVLDAALAADPAQRPGMREFSSGLSRAGKTFR